MFESKITKRGPIFDGRAIQAVDAFLDDAKREVANEGVNDVRTILGPQLQNPTGYYESRITTDITSKDHVVTDGGVVYGPWLEGTSSRNQSTRFKGYNSFRKATAVLQRKTGNIIEGVLKKYLGRMQ